MKLYTFAHWFRFHSLQGVAAYVATLWSQGHGGATIALYTGLYESEVDAIIEWIETGK